MAGTFGTIRSTLTSLASTVRDALAEASEDGLQDLCQSYEVSSNTAFAEADLDLLEWTLIQPEPPIDSGTTIEHANLLRAKLDGPTGHLAGIQRPGSSLQNAMDCLTGVSHDIDRFVESNVHAGKDVMPPSLVESNLDAAKLLNPQLRRFLGVLFQALARQLMACTHGHTARLKLDGFNDETAVQSKLRCELFMSSRIDWRPWRWLPIRCRPESSISEVEGAGCHWLRQAELQKNYLYLLVSEGSAGGLGRELSSVPITTATPTISLGSLIDNGIMRSTYGDDNKFFLPADRAMLCYTLASSLVQLSDDAWLRVRWNVNGIFVLQDPNTHELLDKSTPYLSWQPRQYPPLLDEASGSGKGRSPFSQLVDFARLLMEVHEGERIPLKGQASDDLGKLLEIIHDPRRFNQLYQRNWRHAVKACLSPGAREATEDSSNPDRLREFLYTQVLLHLDSSSRECNAPDPKQACFSDVLGPSVPQASMRDTLRITSPYDAAIYHSAEDKMAEQNARKFMTLMSEFKKQHVCCQRPLVLSQLSPHLRDRVKIAVIDSGARMKDPRILGARRAQVIAQGINFLPGKPSDDWNDVHGHGTHITRLLLEMAPEAQLYVAKVTDGDHIDRCQLHCIAKAINWAVQEWQVDIITMSLVLDGTHTGIKAELEQALSPSYQGQGVCRRIVFAAAGNYGANDITPFPANMPNVIAIHATDGLGTAHNINTPATESTNFATLGRDIPVPWSISGSGRKEVFISGTSFATPIAAAIACNALEYARWNLDITEDQKKFLYSGRCMRRIFKKMALKKGDYNYVQPWTLWRHGDGQGKDVKGVLMGIIDKG